MTFTPDPGVPGLPDLFTTDGTVLLGAAASGKTTTAAIAAGHALATMDVVHVGAEMSSNDPLDARLARMLRHPRFFRLLVSPSFRLDGEPDDVRVSAEILRVARDPKLGHHVLSLTTAHTPKGDRFGALAGSLFARDLGSVVWTVTRGDVGLTRLACTATIPEIAL